MTTRRKDDNVNLPGHVGNSAGKQFSKDYQPPSINKSKAKLAKNELRAQYRAMGELMFEKMMKMGSIELALDKAHEQAEEGELKWLIELIKIMKPNEQQQTQIINAMNANVQRVYVTKEQEDAVHKHIEDVING